MGFKWGLSRRSGVEVWFRLQKSGLWVWFLGLGDVVCVWFECGFILGDAVCV